MSGDGEEQYLLWKKWEQNAFGAYSKWHGALFKAEIKKTQLKKIENVLEVGFGNGAFIAFSANAGFNTVGIEINAYLVHTAKANGYEAYAEFSDIPEDRRFDLIAVFDVLEHIAQDSIPDFLKNLKKMLRPGGAIVARFPNGDSPFGRVNQHGDVTHQTTIGSDKIRYFSELVGLELKCCGSPAMPIFGSPVKYAIYNLVARPARWFFDKFFGLIYLQRSDLTFSPNLTVILIRY